MLQPHGRDLCQVLDVGRDGLSFRYTPGSDDLDAATELDLLLAEGGLYFYLAGLPFRVVADRDWGYETINNSPLGYFPLRRRSVRFRTLTPRQASQLEHFLANYTLREERIGTSVDGLEAESATPPPSSS